MNSPATKTKQQLLLTTHFKFNYGTPRTPRHIVRATPQTSWLCIIRLIKSAPAFATTQCEYQHQTPDCSWVDADKPTNQQTTIGLLMARAIRMPFPCSVVLRLFHVAVAFIPIKRNMRNSIADFTPSQATIQTLVTRVSERLRPFANFPMVPLYPSVVRVLSRYREYFRFFLSSSSSSYRQKQNQNTGKY